MIRESIILEPEQIELLCKFIEAERSVTPDLILPLYHRSKNPPPLIPVIPGGEYNPFLFFILVL